MPAYNQRRDLSTIAAIHLQSAYDPLKRELMCLEEPEASSSIIAAAMNARSLH